MFTFKHELAHKPLNKMEIRDVITVKSNNFDYQEAHITLWVFLLFARFTWEFVEVRLYREVAI